MERSGRLFRPSLVLVSGYLCAPDPSARAGPRSIEAAAAVELLHLATLQHDDLIDEASTRRGRSTVSAEFGPAGALLVGDYLLAQCMQISAALGPVEAETVSKTLTEMCSGQMLETFGLYERRRTLEDYFAAISGKTACLMRTSAFLGAMESGEDPADHSDFAAYGQHLGMAFQIWDDVLDLCAPAAVTGKQQAKDLDNGVYTLPVIYAMREWAADLGPLLTRVPLGPVERASVVDLLKRSGSLDRAFATAGTHLDEAVGSVARAFARRPRPATAAGRGDDDPVARVRTFTRRLVPRHPVLDAVGLGPHAGAAMP